MVGHWHNQREHKLPVDIAFPIIISMSLALWFGIYQIARFAGHELFSHAHTVPTGLTGFTPEAGARHAMMHASLKHNTPAVT